MNLVLQSGYKFIKNQMRLSIFFKGTTMKNDISEVSSQLQENSFIDHVKTLSPLSKENSNIGKSDKNFKTSKIYDRFTNELISIQNSQETYLNEPSNQYLKDYNDFKELYDPGNLFKSFK